MKRRKTKRPILSRKEIIAKRLVDEANLITDPLENLTNFHEYTTKDGEVIKLFCMRAKDAKPECKSWIFDVMERNMKSLYEQSLWGWNPIDKQKELTDPAAKYLVASLNGKFVAFSHFRFDIDYGVHILYCYEIQLEPTIRRKGLGHFIMSALESMATANKMRKVVLTVFRHNPPAIQFFYSLGYKVDKTSPPASEQLDYIILSKAVANN